MPRLTTPQDSEPRGWAAHGWLYFNTDPFDLANHFAHRVADAALRLRDEVIEKYAYDPADSPDWLTFDLFVERASWSVMKQEGERRNVTGEDQLRGAIFYGDPDHWFNAHWNRAHSCRIYNESIWATRLGNDPEMAARWAEYLRGEQ